jgi:putative spermidine/putrescine transport system ATP-binding protein
MPESQTGRLVLEGVSKSYGEGFSLRDVSIDISPGEFVTLLGPSGSGKSTTLNIIAGFLAADGGSVSLDGKVIDHSAPESRNIGMVFQNYALFPHMTAAANVGFPLKMRRVAKSEIRDRALAALDLVDLASMSGRRPRQLSGGQQQRVALARALVFQPSLLLMDEPLGALDKKLRESMQLEIMRMSRDLNITVVYVTHDQEEALSMSDRIAVFNEGRIQQLGTPSELYTRPASVFVADFVGESTIIRGTTAVTGTRAWVNSEVGPIRVDRNACDRAGLGDRSPAAVVLRPEAMHVTADGTSIPPLAEGPDIVTLSGVLEERVYLGAWTKVVVALGVGQRAVVRTAAERWRDVPVGSQVRIQWRIADCVLLPDVDGADTDTVPEPNGILGALIDGCPASATTGPSALHEDFRRVG